MLLAHMSSGPRRPDPLGLLRQFEERARQALLDPRSHEPALPEWYVTILRLWRSPSFEPKRTWAVFSNFRADSELALRVRRVTWDHIAERERCSAAMNLVEASRFVKTTTTPLLTVEDGFVPMDRWAALQAGAPRLRLPTELRPWRGAYLDGESFGLEYSGLLRVTLFRLEWDQEPPEELREVAAWAARARRLIDDCINEPAKSRVP